MTAKQLRAIMKRYGNAGVLFVAAYLALHHGWHRRRPMFLLFSGLLLVLPLCLLWRSAPTRHVKRQTPPPPIAIAPSKIPERLHLPLQDDTAPVPFPAGDGTRPFCANGSIFFASMFYHWTGKYDPTENGGEKHEIIASDEPCSHLYRIAPGMARPQQLTFGEGDDLGPLLSPDGRQLAFTRTNGKKISLCLVSTQGGRVHTLLRLPDDSTFVHKFVHSWSPDGQWFAVGHSTDGTNDDLLLFQPAHHVKIQLHEIREAAWSPDGRLYVRYKDNHARIFRPGARFSVSVSHVVCHAGWLDEHTLIGDRLDVNIIDQRSSGFLRIINDQGQQIRELPLTLIGKEDEYATFDDEHIWHRLPHHSNTILLETSREMSGGDPFGCFRIDTRTGEARLVADGSLIGIAPNGSQVAVTKTAAVGPYKGHQVGPLRIVSLATGRAESITDPLSDIGKGTWQPLATPPAHSHVPALLEAVTRGDLAAVQALLARGFAPDVAEPNGETALMIAAANGKVEIVRLLLQYGARVNRVDRNGNTPLMVALGAEKSADEVPTDAQVAIARMLLQAGARVNAYNHKGYTPLMFAAEHGRAVVVDWLFRHGATPNACSITGETALMLAAAKENPHTVQVLLDHHAEVNLKDKEESTAMSFADTGSDSDNHSKTISLLRQAGAILP